MLHKNRSQFCTFSSSFLCLVRNWKTVFSKRDNLNEDFHNFFENRQKLGKIDMQSHLCLALQHFLQRGWYIPVGYYFQGTASRKMHAHC